MKQKIIYIIMGILLVGGLAVLFYPTLSSWYNAQYQIEAVVGYDDHIEQLTAPAMEQELERAREYNATLTGSGLVDPFIPGGSEELSETYTSILDSGNGLMGVIRIPAIDVNLPIYHGTSEQVLEKGVGHMERTAFPIGGEGNHAVLTGHTALPTATLFTNLDKLVEGDEFYIRVQKENFAYRVDQIMVVEPSNTKPLVPEKGKDYVTLITCTPYAINSHRLLVRGVRIPYEESAVAQESQQGSMTKLPIDYAFVVAVASTVVVIGVMVAVLVGKHRRNKRRPKTRQ